MFLAKCVRKSFRPRTSQDGMTHSHCNAKISSVLCGTRGTSRDHCTLISLNRHQSIKEDVPLTRQRLH